MHRTAPCSRLTRISGAILVLAFLCPFARAQFNVDLLDGVRQKLASLRMCLSGDDDIEVLAQGLLVGYTGDSAPAGGYSRGYSQQQPLPPPPEYMASLDRDIKACYQAEKNKDPDLRKELLGEVRQDIHIKAQDCHKFGMGRMVTVHVSTLKGPVADNGWEVYYKWQCASDFHPAEIRAPTLTSPATLKLAPGNYAIRAQKHLPNAQVLNTETVTVVVGLQPGSDIELPVQ